MRLNKIFNIAFKEIEDVSKSKYVLLSIIGMPILFGVILPITYVLPLLGEGTRADFTSGDNSDMDFMANWELTNDWGSLDAYSQFYVMMITFMLFLFLLLPMILPTITAADSFSGEKDRGTAEGLVVLPISDTELYLGKVFGSLIPSIAGTWIAAVGFIAIADYGSMQVLNRLIYPDLRFTLIVFIVGPMMGFAATNIMIWASTRTSTSRDAQQIGSFITIPLASIVIAVLGISYLISEALIWVSIPITLLIDYILAKIGMNLLDREEWVKRTNN